MSCSPESVRVLVDELVETYRQHRTLLRVEGDMARRIKAIERRFSGAEGDLSPIVTMPRALSGGADLTTIGTPSRRVDAADPSTRPADFDTRDAQVRVVSEASAPGAGRGTSDHRSRIAGSGPSRDDGGLTTPNAQAQDAAVVALVTQPLQDVLDVAHKHQLAYRRRLEKLAKQLLVAPFVDETYGFGWFGLAQIVGEAGDLANYASVAKLWRRMGLAVIDGAAQGWQVNAGVRSRVTGAAALPAQDGGHGFNRARRSAVFFIGEAIIRKRGRYYDLYIERKATEQQKAPEAQKIVWHLRAKRYMEKRLLRDLWRAWRDACK